VRQHPGHRGDTDPGADEHHRTTGIVEHHVTEGQRQGEHVAHTPYADRAKAEVSAPQAMRGPAKPNFRPRNQAAW
jgi:hypothetical protein